MNKPGTIDYIRGWLSIVPATLFFCTFIFMMSVGIHGIIVVVLESM